MSDTDPKDVAGDSPGALPMPPLRLTLAEFRVAQALLGLGIEAASRMTGRCDPIEAIMAGRESREHFDRFVAVESLNDGALLGLTDKMRACIAEFGESTVAGMLMNGVPTDGLVQALARLKRAAE